MLYWTIKETWHFLLAPNNTRKWQIKELSRYAYLNNKTLENILREKIFIKYRTWRHNVKNTVFITFASGVYV